MACITGRLKPEVGPDGELHWFVEAVNEVGCEGEAIFSQIHFLILSLFVQIQIATLVRVPHSRDGEEMVHVKLHPSCPS
jgi:hypothetical protein